MTSPLQSTEAKLFLTVCLIYGFYVTITSPFNNVDALCVAMVDRGSFEIDARVMHDYAWVDGRKYSGYSPGASWLLAPWYWISQPLCALLPGDFSFQAFTMLAGFCLSIPLGALCVVALHRLLREWEFSARACLTAAIAFAFGTMWFVYARRHNSYSFIAAALVFLSFWFVERAGRTRRDGLAFAAGGFLATLAVATDYKQALSVFWVGLFVLLRTRGWRSWLRFGLGALPAAVAIFSYNWHVFGHPLYTPAKFEVARAGEDLLQPGVIPLEGALHFRWEHFWKLLVGPHTGFFLYVPACVLSLVGVAGCLRERRPDLCWALLVASGIFLSNLLLAASLDVFWHGGGTVNYYGPGCRYLLPAVPFLMIFFAVAAERVRPAVTNGLVAVSALVTWMFVVSHSYGAGRSPIGSGWETLPLVVHGKHIAETFGAESVWFNFLASSHFSLGTAGAALLTWGGAFLVAVAVYFLWRGPRRRG